MKRKEMIDKSDRVSLRKQCELLSISRSSLYVQAKGESQINLQIMEMIDGHHLERPTKGV